MGAALTTAPLVDDAERAVALAATDPVRARELALDVLQRARQRSPEARSPEAESLAEWALGYAARELLQANDALLHMQRSLEVAEAAGLTHRAAQVRVSLALEHLNAGRAQIALAELDRAEASVGRDDVRLLNQIAVVNMRVGRYVHALAAANRAVAAAGRARDDGLHALALGGRGVARAWTGDGRGADADLRRAEELRRARGDELAALYHHHNRGFARFRAGDLPGALRFYDETEAGLVALGVPLAGSRLDRADTLLRAGLAAEALEVATAAAVEFEAGRRVAEHAEALVLAARAAADLGSTADAWELAHRARLSFDDQDRPVWSALASCVQADAQLDLPAVIDVTTAVQVAASTADVAADAGWMEQALQLRVRAATAAIRADDDTLAANVAAPAAAARRQRSPFPRMIGWHAQALFHLAMGEVTAARRAARSALRALADVRALVGANDLRVASARAGADIAQLLIDLAAPTGSAGALLQAAEQLRATSMLAAAAPQQDTRMAGALEQLRALVLDEELALLRGDHLVDELRQRRLALEERVLRHSRHQEAVADDRHDLRIGDVRARLGARILVSYVAHHDRLLAVVLTRASSRIVDLGPAATVERELRQTRLALRRVAAGDAAAGALCTMGAARLDHALVTPLRLADRRPVLVVPSGPLHAVPWSLLPTLNSRVVEVTPSVTLWSRPRLPRGTGGTVAVAGPGLPAALAEVAEVASLHRRATVLAGPKATVAATLHAIDGASVAHLACHGTFRADNASFSALTLHDGPLLGFDLARLAAPPTIVVLSACDSGRSGVHAGDELLGLVAAFVGHGTREIVASVVPVDDSATRKMMTALHAALAAGATPAEALLAARKAARTATERAVAASFVTFTAESSAAPAA